MHQVNYIKHLQSAFEAFAEDERLTPWHVSMYYALFHSWNASKFQNPISINRTEMMQYSKIGSVNTYSKCLRQLHEWGYIQYEPSKSPLRGSKVQMFIFDTSTNTSGDTTANTSDEQVLIQQVRPSINNTNNKKQNKPYKLGKGKSRFVPPEMDEVKIFFLELGSTHDQAEQYYNHFESNGWLVGGKAKMKDWKAAARNWVKRSGSFQKVSSALSLSKGAQMNAPKNSNYNTPL